MNKMISFPELLTLVKLKKHPPVVEYRGCRYIYILPEGKYVLPATVAPYLTKRELMARVLDYHNMPDLADNSKKLFELVYPVLDTVEKTYLYHVVKPWRDKVKYIRKDRHGNNAYICIVVYNDRDIFLPDFPADRMYLGMEFGKNYSLSELEI